MKLLLYDQLSVILVLQIEDIYNLCRNVESVMEMYLKELAELDRNTVHLMIDEYRETLDRQAKEHKKEISQCNQSLHLLYECIRDHPCPHHT